MARTRPGDVETEALRRKAAAEGRSTHEVARAGTDHDSTEDAEFRTMVAAVVERDRELLDRLAREDRRADSART